MTMLRQLAAASLAVGVIAAGRACAQDQAPAPAPLSPPALGPGGAAGAAPIAGDAVYKAFHEQAGIQRVIDDLIARVTTDPRIGQHFKGVNLKRLNLLLTQQVCYLTGGPCQYTGDDMRSAHAGLGLRNSDFNALAEDLQLAMDKEGVAFSAQNRLLAKLAPMQRQIVTK
ncbi:group I truncated hemoglobin [Phenylobacterium montanum]|uniref:Group 1 truncated hemoglobin n=1 Tax=Phenylobacterium montanum TaxID=2823693 RepID=A0A975G3D8_9CAUL|nr:group 1 truncated hemoglobin [Caulobacter sp. S6]QUD89828.1 group 1 truncated hemoglobin [Caulobacter sp. S6]